MQDQFLRGRSNKCQSIKLTQQKMKSYRQQGAVLYFSIVASIALIIMVIALTKNSITAVGNANLVKQRVLTETAAAEQVQMVQNFLYEDLRNDKREVQRIMLNDKVGSRGLYVCPDANGNPSAQMVGTGETLTVCPAVVSNPGQPNVSVTTLTSYEGCSKETGQSTEAKFNFKTEVEARVINRVLRQEQYWTLTGFAGAECF